MESQQPGESFIDYQRRRWKPTIHCSNCRNCIVVLVKEQETARCTKGHGEDKPLGSVIRQPYGRGFRGAITCPDYIDMD